MLVLSSWDTYRKVGKGSLSLGWWLGIANEPLVMAGNLLLFKTFFLLI